MRILFVAKQYVKMLIQCRILPVVYKMNCKSPVEKGKILFADAHHEKLWGNMVPLYDRLKELGYQPADLCVDFSKLSLIRLLSYIVKFMKEYATAEVVFISDYFLPVSSCDKRGETTVVQLWHAGGMLKKMGYDAKEDIPSYYKGMPAANFDLVTTSSNGCVPVWAKAWHIPEKKVRALGLARTDIFYDSAWNERNRRRFFALYPEAKGKKIGIYAPSFEGNAAHPYNYGLTSGILEVMRELEEEWFFVVRLHPHMESLYPELACELATEEMFSAADLLITDYSSVLFDYLIYRKPLLLYAPDLENYEKQRGFYLDYRKLPAPVIASPEEFKQAVTEEAWKPYENELQDCFEKYMGACDGQAVERILQAAGLNQMEK